MKIFISLIIGIVCLTQVSAQEHYYYYKGEKIYLELNPDYIFISGTEQNSIQSTRINAFVDNDESIEITEDKVSQTLAKPIGFVEQHPVRYCREINLADKLSRANYLAEIKRLKEDNSNLIVSPYFKNKSTEKIGLSNYFYVKLKHQNDFNVLLEQMAVHNVELVGYNKFMPLWFTLSVTPNTSNAMEMANIFYETKLFQYAEPDLMTGVLLNNAQSPSGTALVPNDPLYPDQWHLNNTGQDGSTPGIDINVEDAWDITLGENVTVAVLDNGFEMSHPDLINNVVGTGYNTATGSSPSVVLGSHGTPCAGIIGAEGNNNEGGSGVAPNVGLVSISNNLSGGVSNRQKLANGINWAVQNGADVISNSWSFSGNVTSSLIDEAINNALTNGRGGRGTVIVFSTGNQGNGAINYPTNSNPDIMAVGAITNSGQRHPGISDKTGSEYQTNWKSNFGDELDVVAPGISITTTANNSGYTDTFDGTSAACPIVAGVAALVLSVNPNLNVRQVNDIIERSARKIRADLYTYQITTDRPNGTWTDELGYGLVDAHQAVLLAQQQQYCQTDLILNGTIYSNNYEVSNTITSTGNIGANQFVIFDAENAIFLNDGFRADASNGSTFRAHIEGCNNADLVNQTSDTDNSIVYIMKDAEERLATDELINLKNYPNPFTGHTTIEYSLPNDCPVTLIVTDLNGKQIAVLVNKEQKTKGLHTVFFDSSNYPAGMYYYTIQAGDLYGTQKMILAK